MTIYLLMLRASIIVGVSVMLIPVEVVFDSVEAALERQGVKL